MPSATAMRPRSASRASAAILPFSTCFARIAAIWALPDSASAPRDVAQDHLEARGRGDLGDASPHLARADHPEALDRRSFHARG